MIHGGIGPRHLNSILSTIGLPVVNQKTLKKREMDIGPVIETVAKKSCLDASENEKRSTIPVINETGDNEQQMTFEEALDFLETGNDDGNSEDFCDHETDVSETLSERKQPNIVEVTVSQDAAWPKRGKAMNSLSGVGHVIGSKTRKCLNFATRNKRCKKCSYYKKVGRPVPEHDCRLNWNHSAKAMEADIAVQLHMEASESELKYTNVIGDDDSSAIKHIREKVNSDVVKFSDFTHIKRSISNQLQEMSKTHKTLTDKVKKFYIKNFSYAVYQSKKKGENDLKQTIRSIVPHMYGEHSLCGQWCNYQADGAYKHKNLPYGKDLSDMHLRDALSQILKPFMSNPTKLMTSGDSQANESLNNVIFSKAPKIRNYSLSESFDFRSSAGVLQFNDGPGYIHAVLHEAMLSPRKETKEYAEKEEKKRKYGKVYKSRKASKKRRTELRHHRKQGEITSNIKLGTGYEKDCILENDDLDITEIPDPPKASKIKCCPKEIKTIFVDLETTKLGYDAEILQIGAYVNDEMSFNAYIVPQGQVSAKATQVTGLYAKVQNGTKSLFKNGEKVDALCPEEGISLFIEWINEVQGKVKILCAHNGNRFDFPILYQLIEKYQLTDSLEAAVTGVVDSLMVFKSLLCKRLSYSLANIYTDIFHQGYEMHDASSDARALAEICQHINLNNDVILKFAHDTSSSINVPGN